MNVINFTEIKNWLKFKSFWVILH